MNDLRIPIGFFFALLGVILLCVAFLAPEHLAPLTHVNVNIYAGLAMLVFGGVMLLLSRRAKKKL